MLSNFKNKKILILGIGEEGIDNLSFFKDNVAYKKIGVADLLPYKELSMKAKEHLREGVELHLGDDYLLAVKEYDVIVKSPGVPSSLINLKEGQKLTSQSDIFLSLCKGNTIGVTGTKGKSTTSLLFYNLLLEAGYSTELIGNIGTPALSFLSGKDSGKTFVYELSSFQLETVTASPRIAVILNVFADHLDRHESLDNYIAAKEKVTSFQSENDYLLYNENDKRVKEIAKKSKANKIPFTLSKKRKRIPIAVDPLYKLAELMKIDPRLINKVVEDFKGLPHRMEYLGKYKGIDFYNDSAATIPEATKSAIENIENVQTVIMGGVDKGGEYAKLLAKIRENRNIRNIVIFKGTPEDFVAAPELSEKLIFPAADMKEAVQHCFNNTGQGSACILSPGFASFNMFRNYKERGESFKNNVRNYK